MAHRSIAASSKALAHTSSAAASTSSSSSSSHGKGATKGGSRQGVMAEVVAMMPQYTHQQLMAHERW
jgi:hypothetical protein